MKPDLRLLFCVVLLFRLHEAVRLVPSLVQVTVGQSYVLYLDLESFLQPSRCLAVTGNTTYQLQLAQAQKPVLLSGNDKTGVDVDIAHSLGGGICGFKLDRVSVDTPDKWSLMAFVKDKNYSRTARVIPRDHKDQFVKQYVRAGESLGIVCGDEQKNLDFCRVTNTKGDVVKTGVDSCYFNAPVFRLEDVGEWKCELSFKNQMKSTTILYEILRMDGEQVLTWFNESTTHFSLGCQVLRSQDISNYCLMERPDGRTLKLKPGLALERYTALGTDASQSTCSLQIQKPLLDVDKGIWKCEFKRIMHNTGGFISTSNDTAFQAKPKLPENVFVHANEMMSVTCRVPYSSPYCYMRDPRGKLHPMGEDSVPQLGVCTHRTNSSLSDNGTWFCGYGGDGGRPDTVYQFQVHVLESMTVRPAFAEVSAKIGSSADLLCSTRGIGDYPLRYCRFLSPAGVMYQVTDGMSSPRLSYKGRGYEHGDCGVTIHHFQASDSGIWSCITSIGSYYRAGEVYSNIHVAVDESGVGLASVLGISFGVIISVLLLGVVLFNRYKRPGSFFGRSRKMSTSDSCNSSNNSISVFDSTQPPPQPSTSASAEAYTCDETAETVL